MLRSSCLSLLLLLLLLFACPLTPCVCFSLIQAITMLAVSYSVYKAIKGDPGQAKRRRQRWF